MISILINWLFIIVICYSLGLVFNKLFKADLSFSLTIILGIIGITTLANLVAFIAPINFLFLTSIIIIFFLFIVFNSKHFSSNLKSQLAIFKNKTNLFTIVLSSLVFAIYSSGFSNINDDGLYYTQTIMWLNQHGLVHGLSNLHLSLGLCSSWHVFQTIFTFPNLINLNDVNGLLLLVFTLFIIEKNETEQNAFTNYLQYLLVLAVSIPFFSAPNPDFAIIILSAIAIQLFISNKNYSLIIVLAAFCFSIKISAIITSFLAIYLLLKYREIYKSKQLLILAVAIVFIHIAKNIYQTAYPLYPYKIASFNFDWKTPESILSFFTDGVKTWAYSDKFKPTDIEQIKDINQWQVAKNLLFRTGSKGIINQIILLSFLLSNTLVAYFYFKKKLEQKVIAMHILTCLSLVIWFVFAPQYRFAIPMLIYFLAFIVSLLYKEIIAKKFKINLWYFHVLSLLVFFTISLTGIKVNGNQTSSQIGTFNKIDAKQILIPKPEYSFKMDTIMVNEQSYFHAQGNRYCWNSPLPCMSKGYEKIIFENYHYRISLRGKNLNEGFKFIYYY